MRKLIAVRSEISGDCGGSAIGEKRELTVTLEIDKSIPHWVKWDLIKIDQKRLSEGSFAQYVFAKMLTSGEVVLLVSRVMSGGKSDRGGFSGIQELTRLGSLLTVGNS